MGTKPKKTNNKKFIIWFWILFGGPVITIFLFVLGIRLFADLPDTKELQNPKTNLATEVYSCDMKVIGKFYAENRTNVKFKEIEFDYNKAKFDKNPDSYKPEIWHLEQLFIL